MNARYAAGTLLGVWAAPILLVGFALDFVVTGMPWRGEGMWTVDWLSGILWLIGPIAAALTSMDSARLTRAGSIHLVLTAPGRQRALTWSALWCAVPLIGVQLLAVITGLVLGGVTRPSAGWGPVLLAVSIHAMILLWCVAVGSAIGRLLPPILAGLSAGATALVAFYVIGDEGTGFAGRFALLETGVGSAPRIGYGYNPEYLGAQVLVLALAAGALLFVGIRERSGRVVPTRWGALQAVAVAVVVAASSSLLPGNRYVDNPFPPDQCSGTVPEICTYAEHGRIRDDLVSKVEYLSRTAVAAGYSELVPLAVHEESRTYRPETYSVRGFLMPFEVLEGQALELLDVVYELVEPTHCDALRADIAPADEFWVDMRALIFTWLDLAQAPSGDWYFDPDHDRLLTAEETAEVINRFARCELERL